MIIVLSLVVGIAIDYFAAKEFELIAACKGSPASRYFWWCFLVPFIGYLMVIALPDRGAAAAPIKPEFDNDALPEL